MKGLIVKGIAGFYFVKAGSRVFRCRARGLFKKDGVTPLVGDIVDIEVQEDGDAVVCSIDERKNQFIRPQVSNVDCFITVVSAAKPEPNFSVVDRFLTIAEKNNADSVICINKADIVEKKKISGIEEIYKGVYPVACVSALTGEGVEELKLSLSGRKYAFAGPSGAGKSTLLNALAPSASAETGEISRKTSRGRHTTRHAEIFETDSGAMIYDTPGFTSFNVDGVEAVELQQFYPEIEALFGKCRYSNCMHIKETGCAVRDAVNAGVIHESRYASYREIYEEIVNKREF